MSPVRHLNSTATVLNVMLSFADDWFSKNIPCWEKRLKPLAGLPVQFLEIGSWEGRSASWLFQHILTHSASRLTTVDCEYRPIFDKNIETLWATSRLDKRTGLSMEVVPSLPAYSFDFVYVDGSHEASHVMADMINALRVLKDGCWMCIDDYPLEVGGTFQVKYAVDSLVQLLGCSKRTIEFELDERGYQGWLRKLNHFPH
jgi:hypothetical protein